jgi:hypothetical protein
MANATTRRSRPKYLSLAALPFLDLVLVRYLRGNREDAELPEFLDLPNNDLWDIVARLRAS